MEIGAETRVVRIEPIADPVPRASEHGERPPQLRRPDAEPVAAEVEASPEASTEHEGALR